MYYDKVLWLVFYYSRQAYALRIECVDSVGWLSLTVDRSFGPYCPKRLASQPMIKIELLPKKIKTVNLPWSIILATHDHLCLFVWLLNFEFFFHPNLFQPGCTRPLYKLVGEGGKGGDKTGITVIDVATWPHHCLAHCCLSQAVLPQFATF